MSRTLVSRIVSGLFLALLFISPSAAQVDIDGDDMDFGPLTSAEQATMFDAGVEAYDSGDFSAAFHIWLPLAQSGNMSAQRNIAHLLRRGMGVEEDHERAVYFYRRAAERGLVGSMVNLASMLRAGQGVDGPQFREAAQWLYIASSAGDPRAQYVLGVMAVRGEGMDANRDLAIQLFSMAAEQGLREARQRLTEAGIELENIGDAPERGEPTAPSSLQPLPDFAPMTSRQRVLTPELRTAQIEPAAVPQVAAVTPQPAAAQPVIAAPVRAAAPVQTVARAQPSPVAAAVPTPAPARVETRPVVQRPAPSQNVPTVQSVSIQPAPANPVRRAQPIIRSTADLVVLPPAPSPRRETAVTAPEEEEVEMNPGLSRLLGGTQ